MTTRFLLGFALAGACTPNAASNEAMPFSCSQAVDGVPECFSYTDLSASQLAIQEGACADTLGTLVTSCPSGAVGCCNTDTAGLVQTQCFYAGTVSALRAKCTGTWEHATADGGLATDAALDAPVSPDAS